jgi:TusA-related sulfurtransferase
MASCKNAKVERFSDQEPATSADLGRGEQGALGRVTRFDAGWMGCDLLPMEFRRRMQAVGLGDIVEFVVYDPSAKEDLPSLARMMGHRIVRTETGEDGAMMMRVERAR